jgi:hypothetical protein
MTEKCEGDVCAGSNADLKTVCTSGIASAIAAATC